MGGAPASIILIVGGPGSGKGLLSKRLEQECGVVHLSSGDVSMGVVGDEAVVDKSTSSILFILTWHLFFSS